MAYPRFNKRVTLIVSFTVLLSIIAGCGGPAVAPAVYELTFASPYTPTHTFSRADLAWIKYVETKSQGRIRIKPFFGSPLLSSDQSVIEIRHGVVDIGVITPIYMRGGAHASRAQAGFYGGVRDIADQVAIFRCLQDEFPIFGQELEGMRVLALQGGNFPGVLTRSRPVRALSDMRGMRLRAPSEYFDVLRHFGADPVNMPMSEVYSAMAKGVIDGVVTPADALRSMHLAEVGGYFTEIRFSRGAYPSRAISAAAWNRLPAPLQAILDESRAVWDQALTDEIRRAFSIGYEYALQEGVQVIPFDVAEQRNFESQFQDSALREARRLNEFGVDGEPIYRAAQRIIEQRNQTSSVNCSPPGKARGS